MPAHAERRRALVVEDEPAIRELLRLHLDLAGFDLVESGDGTHALELARASPFDLILLDVMLPGLDGVSACRANRAGGPNVDTAKQPVRAKHFSSTQSIELSTRA